MSLGTWGNPFQRQQFEVRCDASKIKWDFILRRKLGYGSCFGSAMLHDEMLIVVFELSFVSAPVCLCSRKTCTTFWFDPDCHENIVGPMIRYFMSHFICDARMAHGEYQLLKSGAPIYGSHA